MNEVNPGLGQRTRRVDNLATALESVIEVVIVAAEVGYAVPAIWTREVQHIGIAGLVPSDLFGCDQRFAQRQSFAEDGKR